MWRRIVVLALLLALVLAYVFRWEEGPKSKEGERLIIILRDRWTGQRWQREYDLVGAREALIPILDAGLLARKTIETQEANAAGHNRYLALQKQLGEEYDRLGLPVILTEKQQKMSTIISFVLAVERGLQRDQYVKDHMPRAAAQAHENWENAEAIASRQLVAEAYSLRERARQTWSNLMVAAGALAAFSEVAAYLLRRLKRVKRQVDERSAGSGQGVG